MQEVVVPRLRLVWGHLTLFFMMYIYTKMDPLQIVVYLPRCICIHVYTYLGTRCVQIISSDCNLSICVCITFSGVILIIQHLR